MPRRGETFGFAAIQTLAPSVQRDKESIMELSIKLVEGCVKKYAPNVVGLPELFTTPFFPFNRDKAAFKLAEQIPGPTTNRFCRVARELGIFLITPLFEQVSKVEFYDSSPVISPQGDIVDVYRKSSIPETTWRSEGVINHEKYFFQPGDGFKVFDLGFCKLGQLICYDRHFPEAWHTLSRFGAEVIYVPSASVGRTMSEMFILETRAMSFANNVFSVVSNRQGREGRYSFFGGTHAVDTNGNVLAGPALLPNEIIFSKLDLKMLRRRGNLNGTSSSNPRLRKHLPPKGIEVR